VEKCAVLTPMYMMDVDRKGIEVLRRFSQETALNIHEKGFRIPETMSDCKM